jgi:hypothetical protein
MCLEMAGADTLNGLASSDTVALPVTRRAKMARRIGWDNAPKARSKCRAL